MPRLSRLTAAAVLVVASPLVAAPGDEIGVLIPTPEGFNAAGRSVALGGDYTLVGAPADVSAHSTLAPLVYVYDTETSALLWSLEEPASLIDPDDPDDSRTFGFPVAVSGDRAFVGVHRAKDEFGRNTGAVVQYDLLTGEVARIYAAPSRDTRFFGLSVAASGSLVAVGAPEERLDGGAGLAEGAAYLYNADTGQLLHRCVPSDLSTVEMGASIAVSRTRLLAGAPRSTRPLDGRGRAYLFDVVSGAVVATLQPADLPESADFGYAVALTEDYAFVGAPSRTEPEDFGAVYVFDANTGVQLDKIVVPGQPGNRFGNAIAVDGEYLAISAESEADGGTFNSGAVYLYEYPAKFIWGRAVPQSYSGGRATRTIALEDGRLIAGADTLEIDGERRGGAFIFEAPGPRTRCPGDVDDSGAIDLADLNLLLGDFGQAVTPGTGGDFDESGVVDLADLNTVLGLFGADCP